MRRRDVDRRLSLEEVCDLAREQFPGEQDSGRRHELARSYGYSSLDFIRAYYRFGMGCEPRPAPTKLQIDPEFGENQGEGEGNVVSD